MTGGNLEQAVEGGLWEIGLEGPSATAAVLVKARSALSDRFRLPDGGDIEVRVHGGFVAVSSPVERADGMATRERLLVTIEERGDEEPICVAGVGPPRVH